MNKKDKKKAHQDRLAQALRDNLKRRKQPPMASSDSKISDLEPTDKTKE
ncbi:MAG: hypothetical protein JKY45_01550 [Emcibacter sp.]|nr:hypothetical protein [Emcibacter sp.]